MDSRKILTDAKLIQKKSASCCQEARSDVPASFFFQIFSLKYYNYRKTRECFGIEQVLQKFISTSFSVVYLFCASAEIASWFKNILLCAFSVLQVIRT